MLVSQAESILKYYILLDNCLSINVVFLQLKCSISFFAKHGLEFARFQRFATVGEV